MQSAPAGERYEQEPRTRARGCEPPLRATQPPAGPAPEGARRVQLQPKAGSIALPLWLLAVCALIVVLRMAREVLVPLALAAMIALIFSGLVEALRRWHVPRALSALVLVLGGATALGCGINALASPAQGWLQRAPKVLSVIEHKVRPARAIVLRLNDIASRAATLAGPRVGHAATPTAPGVQLTASELLTETSGVLAGVVSAGVLTLLLLAAGPRVLARMAAAIRPHWRVDGVLAVLEGVRHELGRYYATLAVINLTLGAATALAMWLLGMPTPLLWGVMATLLNFIPYVGSAITLATITVVALVTFDSLPQAMAVAATFLGLATLEGQIVEPLFFGRRLRLNPIVILIALWFGGWLWGIAGIVLALPVLVAVKVAAGIGGRRRLLWLLGPAGSARTQAEEERAAAAMPRVRVPSAGEAGRQALHAAPPPAARADAARPGAA